MSRRRLRLHLIIFCSTLLAIAFPSSPHAEPTGGEQWEFHLAPYVWLAGQKGSLATIRALPPVEIDVDFWDDVLGNINGALFLVGEVRKGRYGALLDIAYTDIEFESDTPGPVFSSFASRTKSWITTLAGTYRMAEKPDASLDLVAGIRYWSVDSRLALRSGALPGREVSKKKDWIDPLAGLKGVSSIGRSRFFISATLMLGGFDVGSDWMWDANVNVGYRWSETFSTTLGYRYLDVDYEKDGFLYDIAQDGPVLGFSWRF